MNLFNTFLCFTLAGILGCNSAYGAPTDVMNCKRLDTGVTDLIDLPDSDKTVILLEFDGGSSQYAKQANASAILRNAIDTMLSKAGVQIVDTSLVENEDIRNAIGRYEREGVSEFSTALASHAVRAYLTGVSLKSTFTQNSKAPSKSYCSHSATVDGVLKIYGINPLKLKNTTEFRDIESLSVQSGSGSCHISQEQGTSLVETAIEEALKKKTSESLYTAFRTTGYVREIRLCGRSSYAWISTPPANGATVGATVKFFEQESYVDPISKETITRRRFIAEGKVAETQNPDEAWVKLKGKDSVKLLRIGHVAEVEQKGPSALCTLLDVC